MEGIPRSRRKKHNGLMASDRTIDRCVRQVASFHSLDTRTVPLADSKRLLSNILNTSKLELPAAEEFVEDAGLFEQDSQLIDNTRFEIAQQCASDD